LNYQDSHDRVLDKLVRRLAEKPGFLFINERYEREDAAGRAVRGEMDVFRTRQTHNKRYKTYYEVKGRHTDAGYERAMNQFARHDSVFHGERWKYVYVTPTKIERVRFK